MESMSCSRIVECDDEIQSNDSMNNRTLTEEQLEHLGYQWGTKSKYWSLWTIWEPILLKRLEKISTLTLDTTITMRKEFFKDFVNKGFDSFGVDSTFKMLTKHDKMAVVRLDFEKNVEPFLPLTEMVEIKASEVLFNNDDTVDIHPSPICVLACAGLADILRAVCKPSDVIVVSGTFVRLKDTQRNYLLLNYHNKLGDLQILRFSFKNMEDNYVIERIKPTETRERFQFKYLYVGVTPTGKFKKEFKIYEHFKWVNSDCGEEFEPPIQLAEDVSQMYKLVYKQMLEKFVNPVDHTFRHDVNQNQEPEPNDKWWSDQLNCGGQFTKTKEPEPKKTPHSYRKAEDAIAAVGPKPITDFFVGPTSSVPKPSSSPKMGSVPNYSFGPETDSVPKASSSPKKAFVPEAQPIFTFKNLAIIIAYNLIIAILFTILLHLVKCLICDNPVNHTDTQSILQNETPSNPSCSNWKCILRNFGFKFEVPHYQPVIV